VPVVVVAAGQLLVAPVDSVDLPPVGDLPAQADWVAYSGVQHRWGLVPVMEDHSEVLPSCLGDLREQVAADLPVQVAVLWDWAKIPPLELQHSLASSAQLALQP
jgi:hypothetical protein